MKNLPLYLVLSLVLFSCKKEEPAKPKVSYETAKKNEKQKAVIDTAKMVVADLPINMDGTNVLIYPIGEVNVNKGSKYDSQRSGDYGYTISNYSEYEITGFLNNLKFQEIGKDTITALTDKPIQIQRVTYLKTHADKTKKQLMVYVLEDLDTNKDEKLDDSDIKSLYISSINGQNFTKITSDLQELIDWNYLPIRNAIYYRTIEDTNKNGEFDTSDILHYFTLNLLNNELKPVEFFPSK
jgi:hypothetical protein